MNTSCIIYQKLKNLFVKYREIEHIEEGRSTQINEIGNKPEQATKAMIIAALIQGNHKYCLLVLPSSMKINFEIIQEFVGEEKISFAKTKIMKRLANCQSGAVSPLRIIVDQELYKNEEIVFNARRLDRSIYILSKDYKQILLNEYLNSIDFPISTTE